jgi:hypothetical protein
MSLVSSRSFASLYGQSGGMDAIVASDLPHRLNGELMRLEAHQNVIHDLEARIVTIRDSL